MVKAVVRRRHTVAWGLGLIYLVWWFLVHGRREHPAWAILKRFKYAHRGLHADNGVPENSLAGFRAAVEAGYGVELDVHLTRDGRLAVIHDSNLKRVCGLDAEVEDLTVEQLRQVTLLGSDETVPLLDDVLPLFEGKTALLVEIKPMHGNHAALTSAVMACLDRYQVTYCVESFDPRVLAWLRKHRPEVVRGQLTQNFLRHAKSVQVPMPVRYGLTALFGNVMARPDFIAERIDDRTNWSHWMACNVWGLQGFYWTVRTPADQMIADRDCHVSIFEGFRPATR